MIIDMTYNTEGVNKYLSKRGKELTARQEEGERYLQKLSNLWVDEVYLNPIRVQLAQIFNSDDDKQYQLAKRIQTATATNVKILQDLLNDYYSKYWYEDWFRNNMGWLDKSKDLLLNKIRELRWDNQLKIYNDEMWKHICLEWLWYELCIWDLSYFWGMGKNSNNRFFHRNGSIPVTTHSDKSNFTWEEVLNTNYEWVNTISSHLKQWWKIPNEGDIKNILKSIRESFIKNVNKNQRDKQNHDEDIAFLMLMIQWYWDFLLKDNRILKCYDAFRWFKDAKQGSTWQLMLIRSTK